MGVSVLLSTLTWRKRMGYDLFPQIATRLNLLMFRRPRRPSMKHSTPHDALSKISEPPGRRDEIALRLLVMSNRAPIRLVKEGGRERIEPTVGGVGTTVLR